MNFHKLKASEGMAAFKSNRYDASYEKMPSGVYSLSDIGNMFESIPFLEPIIAKEELVNFSNGTISEFMSQVDEFLSGRTVGVFQEMKITHKTGYILFGKPGTGKTSMCLLAMKIMTEKYNAICIDSTKCGIGFTKQVISYIRQFQDNPIVLFFDECEVHLNDSSFLPFLDGNESVSGLVFLGCTNHIDRIPDRIKNRKSRIKKCFEIKSLPQEVFSQYLANKIPSLDTKTAAEFCYKACEGELTIDQFKNALLDYRLNKMTIDEAISSAKEEYGDDGNSGGHTIRLSNPKK